MTVPSVCPRCKTKVGERAGSGRPCAACGSGPGSSAPQAGAPLLIPGERTLDDGWGDDDADQGGVERLELSSGGAAPSPGLGASAFAAGGMSFDDDDPFADEVPDASLELDLPSGHAAPIPRTAEEGSGASLPAGVAVPDLALPPPSAAHHRPAPRQATVGTPSGDAAAGSPPPRPEPPGPSSPSNEPALAAPPSGGSIAGPADVAREAAPPARHPETDAAAIVAGFPPPPTELWQAPLYALHVLRRKLELHQDLVALRKKRSPDVALYERALGTHDARMFARGLALACAGLAFALFVVFLPVIVRALRD